MKICLLLLAFVAAASAKALSERDLLLDEELKLLARALTRRENKMQKTKEMNATKSVDDDSANEDSGSRESVDDDDANIDRNASNSVDNDNANVDRNASISVDDDDTKVDRNASKSVDDDDASGPDGDDNASGPDGDDSTSGPDGDDSTTGPDGDDASKSVDDGRENEMQKTKEMGDVKDRLQKMSEAINTLNLIRAGDALSKLERICKHMLAKDHKHGGDEGEKEFGNEKGGKGSGSENGGGWWPGGKRALGDEFDMRSVEDSIDDDGDMDKAGKFKIFAKLMTVCHKLPELKHNMSGME